MLKLERKSWDWMLCTRMNKNYSIKKGLQNNVGQLHITLICTLNAILYSRCFPLQNVGTSQTLKNIKFTFPQIPYFPLQHCLHIIHITKLNFINIYLCDNINEWNCILYFDLCDKSYILRDFCAFYALQLKIVQN